MVVTGGGDQVVAAGRFATLNGAAATGVGALDPVTGATRPFAVNKLITNQGTNSAIWSLSARDGTTVYGTGYDFDGPGNLEGTFAATADGGELSSSTTATATHYANYATRRRRSTSPRTRTTAATSAAAPSSDPRICKHGNAVQPRADQHGRAAHARATPTSTASRRRRCCTGSRRSTPGTVTGQYQAGWTVDGNEQYVAYGGEFPRVNGVAQQGLVRFAVPSIAPNKFGPAATGM